MNLVKLSYKNLVSKPLNMLLSLLLLVLSIALVTLVLQLSTQVQGNLDKNIKPVDMVVGAKGSPLQLVLSSVLHIDNPTGNISLAEANKLAKSRLIKKVIPVSYGDNYKNYRILGTDTTYFGLYKAKLSKGKMFQKSFEVVLGSRVAEKLQLKLGDSFQSSHGLADKSLDAHEHPFTVAGILETSSTIVDNLIVSNLESIWEVHEHEGEHSEDEEKEITSMLIQFKSPMTMVQLPRYINEKTNMQAALPNFEINRLVSLLSVGTKTIQGIALAILLVSGLSIFISLLKAIRERKQELALLRTYGATTSQLLWIVILEGLILGVLGFVIGWILGRIGLWVFASFAQDAYGYAIALNGPSQLELILFAVTLGITILASILASLSIFKLNVSKVLAKE